MGTRITPPDQFNDPFELRPRFTAVTDEFGVLRRVSYSDTRPEIDANCADDEAFTHLALTKALDWAYEQEVRLLWPLKVADRILDGANGQIHLLDVPADALCSVTLGCKATDAFMEQVIAKLDAANASHVLLQRVAMDEVHFALNYAALR